VWHDTITDDDIHAFALDCEEHRLMVLASRSVLDYWTSSGATIAPERLTEILAMTAEEARNWCEDRILEQRRIDVDAAQLRYAEAPEPTQPEADIGAMFFTCEAIALIGRDP